MSLSYSDNRQRIASGDIFAFRHSGALSEFIEHVTGGTYSHVAVAWRFRNRLFAIGATEVIGVRMSALSQVLPADWIATGLQWNDDAEELMFAHYGLPYSYAAAVEVAVGLTPRPTAQICSTFCADVLAKLGMTMDRKGLTPRVLIDNLLDKGGILQHVK